MLQGDRFIGKPAEGRKSYSMTEVTVQRCRGAEDTEMLTNRSRLDLVFVHRQLGEGRPLPPLRTTTLIQTRAPQQLHTQELGFCRMQLATVSNACAKQKRKLASQEPDTRVNGVPRAGETRDDGKRKEDRITSPTEPLTSTH
ncbi:hypothetical protein ABVT39_006410 [Epinephelus coioides]